MSLGLCVLVRDRQDSICVRFARAGLFCAGPSLLCRTAGPAGCCRVRRVSAASLERSEAEWKERELQTAQQGAEQMSALQAELHAARGAQVRTFHHRFNLSRRRQRSGHVLSPRRRRHRSTRRARVSALRDEVAKSQQSHSDGTAEL